MSEYGLVSSLRRRVVVNVPAMPILSARLLKAGLILSLACYLAAKVYGMVNGMLSPMFELLLLPGGLCAVALALRSSSGAGTVEARDAAAEAPALRRYGLVGAGVILVFTLILVVLNTVPLVTSPDESAIISAGYEIAHNGSMRVENDYNDTYNTNIIGGLHTSDRTAHDRFYAAFPGSALLYAPFSYFSRDMGYRFFTALFACIAAGALYIVGWRLLGSWPAALIGTLLFVASPAFGHWSVTVFNNVPVLGIELVALTFLLVPQRLRGQHVAVAGGLMGLALFIRITEFALVLPMLALVLLRSRRLTMTLPLLAGAFAGGVLVLLTNEIFFGSPFFLPHVGNAYISLHAPPEAQHSSQSLLERYFLFAIGTSGSPSNFHGLTKLHDLWFHVRYLGSSTFAFPFLPVAFTGLAVMIAARQRQAWPLLLGVMITAMLIVGIYGKQHNNYFGYGLPIVRSSFVRYSLPVYALFAVAAGGFFLELGRILRPDARAALLLFSALVVILGGVGVAQTYDSRVYGFNRLNESRERDRDAWREIDATLQQEHSPVLLVVGENAMKLVPNDKYPNTINYGQIPNDQWQADLMPVISTAVRFRQPVYLLLSEIQPESQYALDQFQTQFTVEQRLRYGPWGLYQIGLPLSEVRCASCR